MDGHLFEALKNRLISQEPLTSAEEDMLKRFLKICAPGLAIKKVPIKQTIPLGIKQEFPINPITGIQYITETCGELGLLMRKNGWIGQFAGRTQWAQAGRVVKPGEEPCLSWNSIYHTEKKPNIINIFAYEQTQ